VTIREKIQAYLLELKLGNEQVDEHTWIIHDDEAGLSQVVVYAEQSLVVIRVKVMRIPQRDRARLFEDLLRLNAADLVHGAYALENDDIILVDTLESESMELAEFQASMDAIGMALAQHYPLLAKYMKD
jgi:hypothetical protein